MRLLPQKFLLQLLAPLLLLVAVELLLEAEGKPPCPVQLPCRCTDLRIKCVQLDRPQLNYISIIPYFAPSNFETRSWSYSYYEMRVRDQALTSLSLQFPWGVLSLRRIEVTNSLVRRIQPNAFKGIVGVQLLNLSHNLLSSLSSADLADLTQLRELILHDNCIRIVYPGAFQSTPFVARLYLSHNHLSEIPGDIRQLSSLTHLYLQFNNISTVRDYAFAGLRKLIALDLGTLRRDLLIEPRAFCGLSGSNNGYEELPDNAPMSLMSRDRGLSALYLRHNVLHDLNLCALGKISNLRLLNLSGSIFPCTCQSASLVNQSTWLADYGFSPRYLAYDSWQVANCDIRDQCFSDGGNRRLQCPQAVSCARQPVYDPAASAPRQTSSGIIRDWQFDDARRLSYEDSELMSSRSGDPNTAASSGRFANSMSSMYIHCLLSLCTVLWSNRIFP